MSKLTSSLKATTASPSYHEDEDPIAILQRAQAAYEEEILRSDERLREILQDIYRGAKGLLTDDEACGRFMTLDEFARFANQPPNNADRGDLWFHAVAFAYRATSRGPRQKASKHASALWLLNEEGVPADQVAATIEERHGIEKLAREAAERRRSQNSDSGDADWEEANNEASADATKEAADLSVAQFASPSTGHPKQSDDVEDLPAPRPSLRETVKDTTSPPPVGQKTMPLNAAVPGDSRVQSPPVASITITIKGQNDTPDRYRYRLTLAQAKAALAINPKRLPNLPAYLRTLADALKPPTRATRNRVLQYKTSGRTRTTKYQKKGGRSNPVK